MLSVRGIGNEAFCGMRKREELARALEKEEAIYAKATITELKHVETTKVCTNININ